jgi:hypothetical protein
MLEQCIQNLYAHLIEERHIFSWLTKIERTEKTESEIITTRNKALTNRLFYTTILQTTDGSKCRELNSEISRST